MNWNEILQIIISALAVGVAGLITYGFTILKKWIDSKIKNEEIREATNAALGEIESAVLFVNQTFVDQLKKDGKFDKGSQEEAFNKAFDTVKATLSPQITELLQVVYGNFEGWLKVNIEAKVKELKD
ncbi:MAG: hypothetical protein WC981_04095 [Candidatus Dojkabacteria bacterium]